MSNASPILIWFREDLRLRDHPPLQAAAATGAPVIPVYIHAPEDDGMWAPGAASRWWLHHSLRRLDQSLRGIGSRLLLRRGPATVVLPDLVQSTGAAAVYFSRRYDPGGMTQERDVAELLAGCGVEVLGFAGALLHDPAAVRTGSGTPYQVFTPFYRKLLTLDPPRPPLPAPKHLRSPDRWPESEDLKRFELLPAVDWTSGLAATWEPGEPGANRRLRTFLRTQATTYADHRDRPDVDGTARLSPHLRFGEISPRRAWLAATRKAAKTSNPDHGDSLRAWIRQLAWREFSYHLLVHAPEAPHTPLRPLFQGFPWRDAPEALKAWQTGQTGYPIVDAGMRELWATGWMHNRVRMIAASFLVKNLLLPWQAGAQWFWDTLVDADLANNTMGWQWVAGCGADAAPFFRIFNPTTQGRKFDPHGTYVRTWIPELLSPNYPEPIVSHHVARMRALAAYDALRT